MEVIKQYTLYLNTAQRTSGRASDAVWNLSQTLALQNKNSKFYVKLISAVIPYSFSQINSTNNTIPVLINNVSSILTIPIGTYNIIDLLNVIKTQLEVAIGGGVLLDFTYNQSTNFVTLGFNTNTTSIVSVTMSFCPILLQLGFTGSAFFYANLFPSPPFVNATSIQNVNVSPSQKLFIRSSSFTQDQSYEAIINQSNFSDIIADVPILSGSQSYINFYEPANYFVPITNRLISQINLYITDSQTDNEVIDLVLNSIFTIQIVEYHLKTFEENPIHDVANGTATEPDPDLNDLIKKRNDLVQDLKNKKYKLMA